eukprot:11292.XXX_382390_382686_1 [CDS] Oithona nana genome sequencing.
MTALGQSRTVLEKSSTSGTTTTTSSSMATVELLEKLRQLEFPTLERPPGFDSAVNTHLESRDSRATLSSSSS